MAPARSQRPPSTFPSRSAPGEDTPTGPIHQVAARPSVWPLRAVASPDATGRSVTRLSTGSGGSAGALGGVLAGRAGGGRRRRRRRGVGVELYALLGYTTRQSLAGAGVGVDLYALLGYTTRQSLAGAGVGVDL